MHAYFEIGFYAQCWSCFSELDVGWSEPFLFIFNRKTNYGNHTLELTSHCLTSDWQLKEWSYSTGQFRGALSIRGAHFVFDWYFTKFRGAQKISGEMLVISFVREVNHVIMAATLDRRQNPQIQLQTLQSICPFTHVMASVIHFQSGTITLATIQCH